MGVDTHEHGYDLAILADRALAMGRPRDVGIEPPLRAAVYLQGGLWPCDYSCARMECAAAITERRPVLVVHVDSCGGYVSGVAETRAAIAQAQAAGVYVLAYVYGTAASAALWVASAADEVVASPTAQVGGVGVVVTLYRQADDDVVQVVSAATPNKAPAIDDAYIADVQRRVDAIAVVMLADIARSRGVSVEALGDGSMYAASEALSRGLVDRIAGPGDTWIYMGGQMPAGYSRRVRTATARASITGGQEVLDMSEQTAATAARVEALAAEVERLRVADSEARQSIAALTARAETAERQAAEAQAVVVRRDAEAMVDEAIRSTRIAQATRAAWVERAVQYGVDQVRGMLADLTPMAQVGRGVGHGAPVEPAEPESPAAAQVRAANTAIAAHRARLAGGVR